MTGLKEPKGKDKKTNNTIREADIVEAYSMSGMTYYGWSSDFQHLKPKLEELRRKGELLANNHAVWIFEYRNKDYFGCEHAEPFRVRKAVYKNGWRLED